MTEIFNRPLDEFMEREKELEESFKIEAPEKGIKIEKADWFDEMRAKWKEMNKDKTVDFTVTPWEAPGSGGMELKENGKTLVSELSRIDEKGNRDADMVKKWNDRFVDGNIGGFIGALIQLKEYDTKIAEEKKTHTLAEKVLDDGTGVIYNFVNQANIVIDRNLDNAGLDRSLIDDGQRFEILNKAIDAGEATICLLQWGVTAQEWDLGKAFGHQFGNTKVNEIDPAFNTVVSMNGDNIMALIEKNSGAPILEVDDYSRIVNRQIMDVFGPAAKEAFELAQEKQYLV